MKTAPMAGKSWQPSHKPSHHAEGPPSNKTACSERVGLMVEAKPEPHKTMHKSRGTQLLNAISKVSIIPFRIFYQLLKGWCPQMCTLKISLT